MSNSIYCTYLTIYSGNKLPPFYIGSTSVERINKGYHGSVKSKTYRYIWNNEIKFNPNLFKTHIITTHNTKEEALKKELFLQEKLNVVKSSLYINQSYAKVNGFYGRNVQKENNPFFGRKHSSKTIEIFCNIQRTKPSFGGKKHSKETKHKMSLAAKQRLGSKNSSYGRKWFYNPETLENIKCLPEDKPENYIPGRFILQ